jgi:hypothetical protein
MRRSVCWFFSFVFFAFNASAWPVGPRPDAEIANDAQVVVVAHIKPGSLKGIQNGGSYETQATLLVVSVLKGNTSAKEIPIMLHYGVLPVPKSYMDRNATDVLNGYPYTYTYTAPIRLLEDNPSEGETQVIDDIRKDQIWFLRKYLRGNGSTFDSTVVANQGWLGAIDFRDVQPISKENDFKKLLK